MSATEKVAARDKPIAPPVRGAEKPGERLARGTDPTLVSIDKARVKAEAAKAKVKAKIEAARVKARADAERAAIADASAKAQAKADAVAAKAQAKAAAVAAKAQAKAAAALDKGPPLGKPVRTSLLVLFVPGVERDGRTAVDQAKWTSDALQCLTRLFGRATAYPAGQGMVRAAGAELREAAVPIHCYAPVAELKNAKKRAELAAFCRRMGSQTRQHEIGLVIGADYHAIRIPNR